MQVQILPASAAAITQVVKDLRAGQPVAIPTETVYGLAADAMNLDAIRKIFSLKGRPNNHPVIVHIAPLENRNQNYLKLRGVNCYLTGPETFLFKPWSWRKLSGLDH